MRLKFASQTQVQPSRLENVGVLLTIEDELLLVPFSPSDQTTTARQIYATVIVHRDQGGPNSSARMR